MKIDCYKIINIVCEFYGTDFDTINTKSRHRELVEVRQAVCYFVRKRNPNMPLREIGEIFTPPRTHSTIIHSIKTYENIIFSDARSRRLANEITELLKNPE